MDPSENMIEQPVSTEFSVSEPGETGEVDINPQPKKKNILILSVGLIFIAGITAASWLTYIKHNQSLEVNEAIKAELTQNVAEKIAEDQTSSIEIHMDFSQITGRVETWNNKDEKNASEAAKIYVSNNQTQEKILLATVPDLYINHYHNSEFTQGQLYAILRIDYQGSADDQWQDELWRFDGSGKGTKLFSSRGIDFRAAPNNKLIALEHNNTGELLFIDDGGREVKKYTANELLLQPEQTVAIGLDGWSTTSEKFWGKVSFTAYPYNYYSVNVNDWVLDRYELPDKGFSWKLNYDSSLALYQTFPIFFDATSYDEYVATKPTVTLEVYDLVYKKQRVLATTVAEPFSYRWLENNIVEYSTNSGGTKTVVVE